MDDGQLESAGVKARLFFLSNKGEISPYSEYGDGIFFETKGSQSEV
jgi:hypothetical protein